MEPQEKRNRTQKPQEGNDIVATYPDFIREGDSRLFKESKNISNKAKRSGEAQEQSEGKEKRPFRGMRRPLQKKR